MDFLTLCQETARDSGIVAGLPSLTTVAGATGRIAQLVGWVRDAWIDIQNEREDWLWMQRRFTASLTASSSTYSAASLGLSRVGRWDTGRPSFRPMWIYDPATGQSDENDIPFIPYDSWMKTYERGAHDESRPTCWSISPQNELLFGPVPDKAYTIRGGYTLAAQELTADSDEPEMPSQYHRVIIAEAIALVSRSDEVIETLTTYKGQYDRLRSALVNSQTNTPGPLP